MSTYGFGEEEPIIPVKKLGLAGIKKAPMPAIPPDQEAVALKSAEALGFTSRQPSANDLESEQGAVTRKKKFVPQETLFIKGPKPVRDRFVDYCNKQGFKAYWQGIEALMNK